MDDEEETLAYVCRKELYYETGRLTQNVRKEWSEQAKGQANDKQDKLG